MAGTDPRSILAIETSCDETSVALLDLTDGGIFVRSHLVLSQADKHAEFGGVFPNLAKREHAAALPLLLRNVLASAGSSSGASADISLARRVLEKDSSLAAGLLPLIEGMRRPDIGAIAVTYGPGLEPALWVGLNAARALSVAWDIPLYPMNHMEGHIAAAMLSPNGDSAYAVANVPPPSLAILLSGGHTEFDLVRNIGSYERAGETRDDAVGEAYDKAARLLGLSYPGGPKLARLAEEARSLDEAPPFALPRPMIHTKNLDMSFSGLKTAVRYGIEKISPLTDKDRRGIAREFEAAVAEVLVRKANDAIEAFGPSSLILGGGVVANAYLREAFGKLARAHELPVFVPEPALATDNALMIGAALAIRFLTGRVEPVPRDPLDPSLAAEGMLRLA